VTISVLLRDIVLRSENSIFNAVPMPCI